MTDIKQKKITENTHTVNPVAAGIAGVVVGGAAVAAAVVMSSKKNQEKVRKAFAGARDKAEKLIDSVKSQPIVQKSAQNIHEVVTETKKKIEEKT